MPKCAFLSVVLAAMLSALLLPAAADIPQPSPYPISWELDFKYDQPKRVIVQAPGSLVPEAYWYITYTITNQTDQERVFLPNFEMVTREGEVIRSDRGIPLAVFEAVKAREGRRFLEHSIDVADVIRLGEDQARESVAIWKEPMPRMGEFTIYVGGLSGEAIFLTDEQGKELKTPDNKPIILRKTLQLNFFIRGDELYAGDEVNEKPKKWVMR